MLGKYAFVEFSSIIRPVVFCYVGFFIFSSCPFLKNCKKKCFLLDILSDMSHLTCHLMLVPIDIWVVAQSKPVMTKWHILIYHLGNVKRAAISGADNQRSLLFQETITFMQPCLCSWKKWGGNVAIRTCWKVQEIPTLAISFPFFISSLVYSLTPVFVMPFTARVAICLFKKKQTSQWWPQTNSYCECRYWMHKSSNLSESRTQET